MRLVRRALPYVFVVAALVAIGFAVQREQDEVLDALGRIGWAAVSGSLVLGVLGTFATFRCWRTVLRGLGARVGEEGSGAQVFFVSQLGKYLPGSVWPVLVQMEYGRRAGVGRATMLAANALTTAVGVAVGLVVAVVTLPFSSPGVLAQYWWAFLALVPLLALLHPRVLPTLLDRLLTRLGRQTIGSVLDWRTSLGAAWWYVLSWSFFGGQVYVLLTAVGGQGWGAAAAAVGGFALATSAGILAIPVPAGAGVREVVLLAVLGPLVGGPAALAVALASRAVLLLGDVLLAAYGWTARRLEASTEA